MDLLLQLVTAVTRSGAQSAARRELAKPPYQQAQPPWWWRPVRWLLREIARLWSTAAAATGGSAALSVLIGTVVVIVALIAWRVGPGARGTARSRARLHAAPETTAADHRAAAERFAREEQWAQAVRERLRAISRDLEERALVDRRPGRTAYELATEGGRALPSSAGPLAEAADRFARIWYGRTPATAQDYRRLTEIDTAVRADRPVRALVAP